MNDFRVKVQHFEGPLELLLDLIEKRKLHINDVSLSQVTDDYIGYVKALQDFPIGNIAQFILIASTLLLIKSRSLLPNLALSDEEEADVAELEERLRLYQRMRELGAHVRSRFGKRFIFGRDADGELRPVFTPTKELSVRSLLLAVKTVLENIPIKEFIPQAVVEKMISLEEMIERLLKRVQDSLKLSFKEWSGNGTAPKREVIVGFLALLELVKQGIVSVTQERQFQDISIEANGGEAAQYS